MLEYLEGKTLQPSSIRDPYFYIPIAQKLGQLHRYKQPASEVTNQGCYFFLFLCFISIYYFSFIRFVCLFVYFVAAFYLLINHILILIVYLFILMQVTGAYSITLNTGWQHACRYCPKMM